MKKKHEDENEVRIFINLRKNEYKQHNHIATYYDINNSNEVKCFFRLFLEGRKDVLNEGISDELIEDYF